MVVSQRQQCFGQPNMTLLYTYILKKGRERSNDPVFVKLVYMPSAF